MHTSYATPAGKATSLTDAIAALQSLMRELGHQHPAFEHLAIAVAVLMEQEVQHGL